MGAFNKVLWREGMFIRPQHFQQQDRFVQQLIRQQPHAFGAYRYGFWSLELNHDLLSQGKLAIESAMGFFPDGSFFSLPNQDLLPPPLDLSGGFSGRNIYLTALDAQHVIQDIGEDSLRHYRYQGLVRSLQDCTSDQTSLAEIEIGQLRLRLMADQEDLSQYTALPIAHVQEVRPDKKINLHSDFIPPILHVEADCHLSNLCEEMYGLLQYRANVLAERLQHAEQSESAVVADFMMLQLVNRYEASILHLSRRPRLHPEVLYTHLVEMLAQLSTYTRDTRRPDDIPVYNHDAPALCFLPVTQSLRHCLGMVLEQHGTAISFIEQSHGVFCTEKIDPLIFTETTMILGIYADVPQDDLRQHVPNQVKIGTPEVMRDLVSRGIPGVPLTSLPVAPRQIPYHANFCYFSFDQQHDWWQAIIESGSLCLHIGANYNNVRLELWAIRG